MDIDQGKLDELGYGMIISRDLFQALKMTIDFEYQVLKWEGSITLTNKTKKNKYFCESKGALVGTQEGTCLEVSLH